MNANGVDTQRTDFLVGLFVLVTLGIVVGTLIVTSDLGVVRNDLYLRVASAEDLTSDTRVLLQGLQVGRVRRVDPVRDPGATGISFVARLSIQDRFPNGTELALPAGTRAVISQPTPIAPTVVDLVLPERPVPGRFLAPGDTVPAERPRTVLEDVGDIAQRLRTDLEVVLTDTRDLLVRTNTAVGQTQRFLTTSGPLVEDVLGRLARTLDQTERVFADVAPRVGPVHDSLTVTLGAARGLLARLDSVVGDARSLTDDNRGVIREIATSLLRSAAVLEHFADQVSRRPTRLLTGVTPLPDTTKEPE